MWIWYPEDTGEHAQVQFESKKGHKKLRIRMKKGHDTRTSENGRRDMGEIIGKLAKSRVIQTGINYQQLKSALVGPIKTSIIIV